MAGLVFVVFAVFLMIGYPIVSSLAVSTIFPTLMHARGATSIDALIRAILVVLILLLSWQYHYLFWPEC